MRTTSEIQVGDQVVVGGGVHGQTKIETVTKITKTQITVSGGMRFTRGHGRQIGGGMYHGLYVHLPEEGEIAKIEAKEERTLLMRRLSNANWKSFPTDSLKMLWDAVQKEFDRIHG